jgi:hypothetical protein
MGRLPLVARCLMQSSLAALLQVFLPAFRPEGRLV